MEIQQFLVTPAAGKRLIAKGIAAHPATRAALAKGRLVIVAGTTNGYVAEEILAAAGQDDEFDRKGFRRGMVTPPGFEQPGLQPEFPGDVVLVDGQWERGKQIFDVVDEFSEGDVVLKGANAVHLASRQAGVYVGHPQSGTIGAAIPLVVGSRVRLIVPVGLEKRVTEDIHTLAGILNSVQATGPRMMPMPGEVFTELDAVELLTGAAATLLAGGGVYGAEGCVFVGVRGDPEQLEAVHRLLDPLLTEPPCQA